MSTKHWQSLGRCEAQTIRGTRCSHQAYYTVWVKGRLASMCSVHARMFPVKSWKVER